MFPGSFSPAAGPETLHPFPVPAHAAFWTMLVVCPCSFTLTGVYICLINLKGHLNVNLVWNVAETLRNFVLVYETWHLLLTIIFRGDP